MDRRRFIKLSGLAGMVTLVLPSGIVHAFSPEEFSGLDQSFFNPADAARPYTMWFWMNGHVTKEGITNDLEAMKRVGIGGVFNFDAGTGIPKGPIEYLSPAWLELKKHAVNEAARLGLAFTMHNCPGWSSSGGPWITPDKAMQQLTWSETFIQGGKTAKLRLPKPFHKHDYYREIAVLAYPSLAHEAQLDELVSKITSATGAVKLKSIKESDYTLVTRTAGNQAWLQFEFKKPFKARSLSFITSRAEKDSDGFVGEEEIVLEASDNGKEFKELYKIRIHSDAVHHERVKSVEIDFPEVQATFFRLRTDHDRAYSQIHFSGIHKFEDWRKRANFQYNGTGKKELTDPAGDVVPVKDIIDVTPYMSAEGELNWSAPEGRWTILRIGFTPVGEVNHAAPDSGLGLECDKYSQEAITFHFNKMMDILLPAIGPLVKKGQMGLEIDSYEVGMQNWTPGFERIFKERNHYDIIQYLPAMTGRIVSDIETTDRVLWDLRRTQADLLADNYYGKFDQLCNDRGIISFIQPYDRGPMEEMQIGSRADSLMGEFWNGLSSIFQNNLMMKRTCKLASSMAHVNAQKITGAEAFTGEPESARWQEYPFMMKAVGDKAFSNGINRMIIHRFAHQAYENALPGMTMGPWGIHFDRTNTWWEQGSGWLKYLTRCQSLLQQGLFVADLAYFTGEDPGVYTIVNREELNPIPPTGYDYDLINAEVLLNKAKVINSRLVLPDGMSYRILVLQSYKTISIDLLKKIEGFINDGLTVVGAPPSGTPGLNSKESEAEFAEIIRRIWGEPQNIVDRNLGKGRVFWGQPMSEILNLTGLQCDFEFTSESGDAPVLYLHRTIDNQEVYFMTNQRRKTENIVAEFRVENKKPEIWDALSGTILHAPVYE
ncbi:MAG: glycosyl hydrolase, partial [Cytophagaceae bacterium]